MSEISTGIISDKVIKTNSNYHGYRTIVYNLRFAIAW
jgi:hypothetical protein